MKLFKPLISPITGRNRALLDFRPENNSQGSSKSNNFLYICNVIKFIPKVSLLFPGSAFPVCLSEALLPTDHNPKNNHLS